MTLRLYDTLTRTKRDFVPLDANNVRVYVCGPTVYDFAHIGNARPVIVFDVLFRLLQHLYGPEHVTYVRNITDVDDKIIDRARQDFPEVPLNEAIAKVTSQTEKRFHEDVAALGCLEPTEEPYATRHIPEMIAMIERLITSGHAYPADGHVLFAVQSFDQYGKLARRSTDDMIAGARVEVAPYKKGPMDFVLWKPSAADEPGWESPWGRGRPGWHIECSAMSAKHLGETFDIHGGGIDLMFPHHENELAQSRCAFHTPVMANYWMHNGFLQVEGEKMSKSLGNFFTIRELLDKWPGDVLRLQMLSTHYRRPIDWTERGANLARNELDDWAHVLGAYYEFKNDQKPIAVIEALSDDLNTPNAITVLRDLYSRARSGGFKETMEFAANCRFLGFRKLNRPGLFASGVSALNVGEKDLLKHIDAVEMLRAAIANNVADEVIKRLISSIREDELDVQIEKDGRLTLVQGNFETLNEKIEDLIAQRIAARKARDFEEADRIRKELDKMDVDLEDHKDGTTTWKSKVRQ